MTAKKIISVLLASAKGAPQFVCPAATSREEDVVLLFKDDLAAKNLEVVRLSLEGLPETHAGEKIDWLINFGIRETGSGNYVNVPYTMIITPRPGRLLVIFDGEKVRPVPVYKATLAEYAGKIAVDLDLGDPGAGWDGQT
jgi:hypothetical protein